MTQREELVVRTGFDNTKLASGVRSAKSMVKEGFGDIAKEIGKAFLAGEALHGIDEILSKFEDLQTRADNLNVSTDFLQGMKQIADENIVRGFKTFNAGLEFMAANLGKAKNGAQDAINLFTKYGITVGDIASLNTEQMFYRISDAMKSQADPTKRAAMAYELLSASGVKMTGVMSNGSEALKGMVDAVDKLSSDKVKNLSDAKHAIGELFDTLTVAGGWVLNLFLHDIPAALGRLSTGMAAMQGDSKEKAHQWMQKILKDSKDKVDAEIAAEDAANKKILDDKKKSDDKRIKKADEVYNKLNKHEEDEADRLFKIEFLKKNIAALDQDSVEYHEARARLAQLQVDQEKKITEEKKQQAEKEKFIQDYQKTVREKSAEVTKGTIPTVEALAGTKFSKRLEKAYGAGGVYDLSKGDGPMAHLAQVFLLSQKQAQSDFTYGKKGAYEGDLKRMNNAKYKLMDMGVLPDTRDMRNISKATANSEMHLAALYDQFSRGTGKVQLTDPK